MVRLGKNTKYDIFHSCLTHILIHFQTSNNITAIPTKLTSTIGFQQHS